MRSCPCAEALGSLDEVEDLSLLAADAQLRSEIGKKLCYVFEEKEVEEDEDDDEDDDDDDDESSELSSYDEVSSDDDESSDEALRDAWKAMRASATGNAPDVRHSNDLDIV